MGREAWQRRRAPIPWSLDLSSSVALPSQIDLIGVFLRVGGAFYSFDRSRDPALLAAIAAGGVRGLALTGVGRHPPRRRAALPRPDRSASAAPY